MTQTPDLSIIQIQTSPLHHFIFCPANQTWANDLTRYHYSKITRKSAEISICIFPPSWRDYCCLSGAAASEWPKLASQLHYWSTFLNQWILNQPIISNWFKLLKSNHSKPGLNLSSIYNIAIHIKMHLEIVRINGTVKNLNRYTLLKNFSQANVETVDTLFNSLFCSSCQIH